MTRSRTVYLVIVVMAGLLPVVAASRATRGGKGTRHVSVLAPEERADNTLSVELLHASDAAGAWQTEAIAAHGLEPAATVDASGKLHVAYLACSGGGQALPCPESVLRYATNASGPWRSGDIATPQPTNATQQLAIRIGDDGALHVAFLDASRSVKRASCR